MKLSTGFIFFLFLISCTSKTKTNTIYIEIDPDKLILESRQIIKSDFERELKIVIEIKLKEGFKREELVINLKVDKDTRRGDIADIETAMRRLNVRKIIYSELNRESPQT